MDILFEITGRVSEGKKRGKKMGFPTANFPVDPATPTGVFISQTKLKGRSYPSSTFIGTVDTFDETDFVAETYILDFDQDLYNKKIVVKIIKKLRDNKKFGTEAELVEQMKKDEEDTRSYFRLNKTN